MRRRLQYISKLKFTGDVKKDLLALRDAVQQEFDYVERTAIGSDDQNVREGGYVIKDSDGLVPLSNLPPVMRVLDTNSSEVNIENSAAETNIVSTKIPAGVLGQDGFAILNIVGDHINQVATTLRVRIYFNGKLAYDDISAAAGAGTGTADVDRFPFFAYLIIAARNSTVNQTLGGFILSGNEPATVGWGNLGTDEVVAMTPIGGQGIQDTTKELQVDVTITLGTANVDSRFRKRFFFSQVSHGSNV